MTTLQSVRASLDQMRIRHATAKARKETIEAYLKDTKEEIRLLEEENEKLTKVAQLLQLTAAFSREQAKTHMEALVTSCLRIVFSSDISFASHNLSAPGDEGRGAGGCCFSCLAYKPAFTLSAARTGHPLTGRTG